MHIYLRGPQATPNHCWWLISSYSYSACYCAFVALVTCTLEAHLVFIVVGVGAVVPWSDQFFDVTIGTSLRGAPILLRLVA